MQSEKKRDSNIELRVSYLNYINRDFCSHMQFNVCTAKLRPQPQKQKCLHIKPSQKSNKDMKKTYKNFLNRIVNKALFHALLQGIGNCIPLTSFNAMLSIIMNH